MGLIPKFIHEMTKNKVIFLQQNGDLFSIMKSKYVKTNKTELTFKKSKKKFTLDDTNILNKYGKKVFFKEWETQKTLKIFNNKPSKLDSDETDAFLGKGFITGFIRTMKGNIFDITSIIIGALIGFFGGAFFFSIINGAL